MKVLVSGAGIAGGAVAFWLSKAGHAVTVVERFPQLRASGLQLDLRGHGIEVMRKMGLEEAFNAKKAPEQGLEIVGSSGRRWAYFPINKPDKGLQGFTTDFEIMRADLCNILYEATKNRAKYVFGTSIRSFEDKEEAIDVTFENGATESFDLVVGADGQGSRTRRMMVGAGNSDGFIPLGNSFAGYVTIPRPIEKGEGYNATAYIATGGRSIMTRRHSPHETQAYIGGNINSDVLKDAYRKGVKAEKEALAQIFKGAGWRSDEIVEAMMVDNDFYLAQVGIVKLEHWHKGRVALVGDAGYCPSANTGMGTTSAMVGGYVLAGELAKHCQKDSNLGNIKAGLESYEKKFRPFMDFVQKGLEKGVGFSESMPQSAWAITCLNAAFGIASLLKIDIANRFMLRENIKDWDLPEYDGVFGA